MKNLYLSPGGFPHQFLEPTVDYIAAVQSADGAIAWFDGGHLDPWDHVESAMGLSIGGRLREAERAYAWLRANQLPDGSWYARYEQGRACPESNRETNFCAYIAVGVWHHYLISEDTGFLRDMWPAVERAIEFVLRYQAPTGEIWWAVDERDVPHQDALITGSSSICKSLACALEIAAALGHERPRWEAARARLADTLRYHPQRFDRTWESKARFSMDWFYPVLSGVITGAAARTRLERRWHEFVEEGTGCRCVADRPWMTVAESCELVMSLLAAGERNRAMQLFSWLHAHRDSDGAYWAGVTFPEGEVWPVEKPAWTAAAVVMAADALTRHTAAWHLFADDSGNEAAQATQRADHG